MRLPERFSNAAKHHAAVRPVRCSRPTISRIDGPTFRAQLVASGAIVPARACGGEAKPFLNVEGRSVLRMGGAGRQAARIPLTPRELAGIGW